MQTVQDTGLIISSAAFEDGEMIPSKYTCEGKEINPPLKIHNVPTGTQSLAVIVEDPDAPGGTYDHWIAWNIPVSHEIKEKTAPGISGSNSSGETGYKGPCPPSGIHRYYFNVYALDTELDLEEGAGKEELMEAMSSHILMQGTIMGRYQKTKS